MDTQRCGEMPHGGEESHNAGFVRPNHLGFARLNAAPFLGAFGVVVLVSLAGVVKYGTKEAVARDVLSTADPLLNSNP